MRLPLNRPSLEPFREYQQAASTGGLIEARFLGTSSVLFQDGETAILSDGFVTRPGMLRVLLGRIGPDPERIRAALARLGTDSIAALFTSHAHYDHALDAPLFAQLTGAVLLGSPSTANLGRGVGLPASALRVVGDGEVLRFGKFELTFIESEHSPRNLFPGTIDEPLVPPRWVGAWRSGTTYSVLIRYEGRGILVHGSSNFRPGALRGYRAEVVYLGVTTLARQSEAFVDAYWDEVVRATGARRVIPVHWDDFFRGLDQPLRAMPYAMDDSAESIRRVLRRAAADGVEVLLPLPWQPTDPFAGLP